jgi:pyruvate-formate lyase-activating enzyme
LKVLLVYPNIEQNAALPQVGLSQLSACLKAGGHEVSLVDYTYLDLVRASEILAEEIERVQPGLVGVSIRSFEWDFVCTSLLPVLSASDAPVVVGGPHPTAAPDEVMAEPAIDFLVRGEGEEVLMDLVALLQAGESVTELEGCWVRSEAGISQSHVRQLNQDLDSLPLPDWDIWDRRHFVESHSKIFVDGPRRIGALETSRGCPYACPYCISPTLHELYKGKGKYHREKSVDRIIAEVLDKKDRFGLDYVNFIDETFLLRDSRVEEFCDRWQAEVGLPFRFTTRPETVTDERIRLVAEAGANLIGLGIESGDPDYRREHLNRGYSQEQVSSAVSIIKKHNVKVFGFFVMGMPHETRENIEQTLNLIRELRGLGLDHYMVTLCYPFKGTPFYDVAVREGLMATDHTGAPNVWEDTPLSLPGLPRADLVRLRGLVSYFGNKSSRWRPLMGLCEKNTAAFYAWKVYRKIERKVSPNDIL